LPRCHNLNNIIIKIATTIINHYWFFLVVLPSGSEEADYCCVGINLKEEFVAVGLATAADTLTILELGDLSKLPLLALTKKEGKVARSRLPP